MSELFGLKSLRKFTQNSQNNKTPAFSEKQGFYFNCKWYLALSDFFHPFRIPFPGDFKGDCAANHDSEQAGIRKCPQIDMGGNRCNEEHESTIVHEMGSECESAIALY